MKYISNTTDFQFSNTVVSLGKFDGVHIGHRRLLRSMLSEKENGRLSAVFSFSTNPGSFFSNSRRPALYTEQEKRDCLERLGVDLLICYPFTEQTARMEPEEFIERILVKRLGARLLVVGEDFRFGYDRRGDAALLERRSGLYGYQVRVFDKVTFAGRPVSSSLIRSLLLEGRLAEANQMLGQAYFIKGEVLHGNEIGRTLGMPTINLGPPEDKLLPPNGVYVSAARIGENRFRGITNIGYKPTVGGETRKGVETYLYGFDGDLYGETVCVELYEFVRGEKKFASLDELKEQMHRDMEYGRNVILPW